MGTLGHNVGVRLWSGLCERGLPFPAELPTGYGAIASQ